VAERKSAAVVAVSLLVLVLAGAWMWVAGRGRGAVVVYCAHDLIFAQQILDEFTRKSGIEVSVLGDTEAAKSLGLVQRLIREKDHPNSDVFWNNEPLGTLALAEDGLLEPYRSQEFDQRPPEFRDESGEWAGFGARFRVWIVNAEKMPATQEEIDRRLAGSDLSRMAVAVPLYGTTLTHYSLLWNRWGADELKKWHLSLKDRGCSFVKGNGAVKDLVASGACDFGLTDTDDFFVAKDAGAPVAMLPVRVDGEIICIPNTVSLVRGSRHRADAARLIDFLLSAESDIQLAKSGSRQVPVHLGVTDAQVPSEAAELLPWTKDAAAFSGLETAREECLGWLQKEFAP